MGLFTGGFKLLKTAFFEVSKNKYSKCTHRNYPMIELKQYIDNIVLNSNNVFP